MNASSSCAGTASAIDYHIKVINPENKGGFEIKNMTGEKYDCVDDLEKALVVACPGAREFKFQFGFIDPGHGYKGKQQLIVSDKDLQCMYIKYSGKSVKLWLEPKFYRRGQDLPYLVMVMLPLQQSVPVQVISLLHSLKLALLMIPTCVKWMMFKLYTKNFRIGIVKSTHPNNFVHGHICYR